jgi:predicted Rdx family selenoprotein
MTTKRPRVEVEYCTQCRWRLRAAWMAQELLTTFQDDIGELALVPGTGGIFDIRANWRAYLVAQNCWGLRASSPAADLAAGAAAWAPQPQ